MPETIGPHLLGRKPNPPDPRDFTLEKLKGLEQLSLAPDLTLADVHELGTFNSWWGWLVFWRWWKETFLDWTPPAPPSPTPGFGEWTTLIRLDQGDTGHCCGFGGVDWGNSTPVADEFADADGHALYYECKTIDGEPGEENGSWTRSVAKALQNRGRLAAYAFAANVDEVDDWLDHHGPVFTGTNWYEGMFWPDEDGRVTVTGDVAGGHEWVILDRDPNTRVYECLNSWGPNWGKGGLFYVTEEDYARLFREDGDACLALELPR